MIAGRSYAERVKGGRLSDLGGLRYRRHLRCDECQPLLGKKTAAKIPGVDCHR